MTIQRSDDTTNDLAKIVPYHVGELDSQTTRDRMKDSETPFHPEEIKDKTAEIISIKNTIDQCSVKQTETELSRNLNFEVKLIAA